MGSYDHHIGGTSNRRQGGDHRPHSAGGSFFSPSLEGWKLDWANFSPQDTHHCHHHHPDE